MTLFHIRDPENAPHTLCGKLPADVQMITDKPYLVSCKKCLAALNDLSGGMKKIDHRFTREIVCPYCGYVYTDSWEINSGEEDLDDINCAHCDELFSCERNVIISYSTEVILS